MITLNILGLEISELITLLTISGAALTWLITKWLERRKQLADEKEKRYAKLLGRIHVFTEVDKRNANKWICDHKELWLFANDKVLIAITNLFDNYSNSNLSTDYKKQIAYYMRKDIYKSRYTLIERFYKSLFNLFVCKSNKLNKDHFRDIKIK